MDYSQSELNHLSRMWHKMQEKEAKPKKMPLAQKIFCLLVGRWDVLFR